MNFFEIFHKSISQSIFAQIIASFISYKSSIIRKYHSLVEIILIMGRNIAETQSKASTNMQHNHVIIFFCKHIWEVIEIEVWEFNKTKCIRGESLN